MAEVLEFSGREVRDEALTWPDRARAAVITDTASYTAAADLLLGVKALRKRIAETFDPHVKRAFEAHRALTREKADAEAPLTEAERIVKDALVAYDREQERQRQEAQRKADEEARRREEDERLALAAAMEKEGNEYGDAALVREAEALIAAPPPPVVAAPVAKATPKVAGVSYRTTYSAQVTDIVALIRFVAANPTHVALLTPNITALNGQARSLKQSMRIPGVRVVESRDVAAGGR